VVRRQSASAPMRNSVAVTDGSAVVSGIEAVGSDAGPRPRPASLRDLPQIGLFRSVYVCLRGVVSAHFGRPCEGAKGGKRLVVDISNSDVVGVTEAITNPVGVVGGVIPQPLTTDAGRLTRLNINVNQEAECRVRAEGTSLKVMLAPARRRRLRPVP